MAWKREDILKYAAGLTSLAGAGFMIYLTRLHYTGAVSDVCDISAELSCSVVNLSAWSELFGIPISVLGLGYFLASAILLFHPRVRTPYRWVLLFSIFSLAFGLYLTSVEHFVLNSICIFCEGSKVLMIALIVLSALGVRWKKEKLMPGWVAGAIAAAALMSYVSWIAGSEPKSGKDYSPIAQCLTEQGVFMYSAYWCPSCAKVKRDFGEAFKHIAYVECDARGENAEAERCVARQIRRTPTWIQEQDGNEVKRIEGALSPEKLAETFGCPIP